MSIYRIRVVFKGKGIERTLPYELGSMEIAEQAAEALNIILEDKGYHHYTIPQTDPQIVSNQKNGNKYGRK